jgi:hypothetical protein
MDCLLRNWEFCRWSLESKKKVMSAWMLGLGGRVVKGKRPLAGQPACHERCAKSCDFSIWLC